LFGGLLGGDFFSDKVVGPYWKTGGGFFLPGCALSSGCRAGLWVLGCGAGIAMNGI
jgi:hypothetical protein